MTVFHLITPDDWERARTAGQVVPDGFAEEGFVHCSTDDQVEGTIDRHFAGVDHLLLLRLDDVALGRDRRWDEVRPGERYPHLYRPISADEVLEVVPWHRPTGTVSG